MEDRTITLINEDGSEVVCDILFTYFSDKFNKNYVVFQVRASQEVSAAVYYPTDVTEQNGKLDRVETDEEWDMLEELLADYSNQMENQESGCSGCAGCGSDCSEGCSGCGNE